MKKKLFIQILKFLPIIFLIAGCKKDDNKLFQLPAEYNFEFSKNAEGWSGFFSDYPASDSQIYELDFALTHLPVPLDEDVKALKISGNNHSDDLLSIIYRKFDNLQPNKEYSITFDIELATHVATGSPGIGGSPDLSYGAGGIPYAPQNTEDYMKWYRPNFVSALQAQESNNVMMILGTIGVADSTTQFTLINRNNLSNPMRLKASNKGELWLLIGTDSGFEGITTLYYKSIRIRLE
jgi:hypothetical protein